MGYEIIKLKPFDEWYDKETLKSQIQIDERIRKIQEDEHFGSIRDLKSDLYELKFKDGRRIYYTIIPDKNVVLLLGGNKNGQNKDITKAKNIIKKAKERR